MSSVERDPAATHRKTAGASGPDPAAPSYVLGTGEDELGRLAFQNRRWADATHAAWRRAEIRIGHRVLDLGCGPGFAAFDLAEWVTREGRVVGLDESARYVEHLNEQARVRRLPQLEGVVGDVHDAARALGDRAPFDAVNARWVLCFVADVPKVLSAAHAVLKPGGVLVVHDYFNYRSMTTAPRRPSHDRAVAATIASWEARGGDTDVMGRVPGLLEERGFEILHLDVHARAARPDDPMYEWPLVWWRIYAPKLVAMGLLDAASCEDLLAWIESRPAFMQCPPVYELIARRR